jgi:hypothetical protein
VLVESSARGPTRTLKIDLGLDRSTAGIPEDNVCSPTGNDNGAHNLYAVSGMADQAADYAMQRLSSNGTRA